MQIVLILALVFSIIIAIFAVQNTQSVAVRFLTFETQQLSVSVVVLASAAIGAILTFLFGLWRTLRSSLELRSDRKKIEQQEKTIQELQNSYQQTQERLKQLQSENEQLRSRLAGGRPATPPQPTVLSGATGPVVNQPSSSQAVDPNTPGKSGAAPTPA